MHAARSSLVALLLCITGAPVGAQLSGWGSATIDGVLARQEWEGAGAVEFEVDLPEGGTAPATFLVMNDEEELFFFLTVEADADAAGIAIEFDANDDGAIGVPFAVDDFIELNTAIVARDGWRTGNFAYTDSAFGGVADVEGVVNVSPMLTRFELSHPFDSGDMGWDIDKAIGETLGFIVVITLVDAPDFAQTLYPGPDFSSVAPILLVPEPSRALAAVAALLALALLATASTSNAATPPEPIGVATLRADGSLELRLRAEEAGGPARGDALLVIAPTDAGFRETLEHVGGLRPGETKPVPPWPDARPPAPSDR